MRKLLFIPMGVEIKQKSETMPLEKAAAVLRSKKRRRITAAVRHNNDRVTITRHVWRCCYCGGERPAYYRHLKRMYPLDEPKPLYDPAVLNEWASTQPSLFPRLWLFNANTPITRPRGTAKCPHCHRYVSDNSGYHVVELAATDDCFVLTIALGEKETREVRQKNNVRVMPLVETITFDVRNHSVTVDWSDGVAHESSKDWTKATVTAYLINQYQAIKRPLKRFLMQKWNGRPLPFHEEELSVDTFALMTIATGWRRDFYDAIPFEGTRFRLAKQWQSRLWQLTSPSRSLAVLRRSSLPQNTKIRYRMLVANQGLLLYVPELERLWSSLEGDEECFSGILKLDWLVGALSDQGRGVSFSLRYSDKALPSDCVVNRYFFHRIHSVRELFELEEALATKTNVDVLMPPLYAIYQNGEPVALLTMREDLTIASVTGLYGLPVEDPYVLAAFEKWCERFQVRYAPATIAI